MSSFINKFNKKLAPKAPIQRRTRVREQPAASTPATPVAQIATGDNVAGLPGADLDTPGVDGDATVESQAKSAEHSRDGERDIGEAAEDGLQEDHEFEGGDFFELRQQRPAKRRRVRGPVQPIQPRSILAQDALAAESHGRDAASTESAADPSSLPVVRAGASEIGDAGKAQPESIDATQGTKALESSTISAPQNINQQGPTAGTVLASIDAGPAAAALTGPQLVDEVDDHDRIQEQIAAPVPRQQHVIPATRTLAQILAAQKHAASSRRPDGRSTEPRASVDAGSVSEAPVQNDSAAGGDISSQAAESSSHGTNCVVPSGQLARSPTERTTESLATHGAPDDVDPPLKSSRGRRKPGTVRKRAPTGSGVAPVATMVGNADANNVFAVSDQSVAVPTSAGQGVHSTTAADEELQNFPPPTSEPTKRKRRQPTIAATLATADSECTAENATEPAQERQTSRPQRTSKRSRTRITLGNGTSIEQQATATPENVESREVESDIAQPAKQPQARARGPNPKKRRSLTSSQAEVPQEVALVANVADTSNTGAADIDGIPEDGEQPQKRKRRRAKTPDDAEDIVIDTAAVKLSELCQDRKQGKKSKLEAELQDIDWTEIVKRRKEAQVAARAAMEKAKGDMAIEEVEGDAQAEQPRRRGPRLRMNAGGEIVLDADSLTINRHAIPTAVEAAVEESDLTKRINSQSWLLDTKRNPLDRFYVKSEKWSSDETDLFYGCLKMFGTDFDMISKMFTGRTRRMIKLKFTREERINEPRIRAVLLGKPDPMNLETYCGLTGKAPEDYKDPDALALELREDEERQRARIEQEREEVLQVAKVKQEIAKQKAEAQARRKAGEKVPRKKRTKKIPDNDASAEPVVTATTRKRKKRGPDTLVHDQEGPSGDTNAEALDGATTIREGGDAASGHRRGPSSARASADPANENDANAEAAGTMADPGHGDEVMNEEWEAPSDDGSIADDYEDGGDGDVEDGQQYMTDEEEADDDADDVANDYEHAVPTVES